MSQRSPYAPHASGGRGLPGPPGRHGEDIKSSTPFSSAATKRHHEDLYYFSADEASSDADGERSNASFLMTTPPKQQQHHHHRRKSSTKRNNSSKIVHGEEKKEDSSSLSSYNYQNRAQSNVSTSPRKKRSSSAKKKSSTRRKEEDAHLSQLRKLPSDVSPNEAIKKQQAAKEKKQQQQKKAMAHGKQYHSLTDSYVPDPDVMVETRKTMSLVPDLIPPDSPDPAIQYYDSCDSSTSGRETARRANQVKTNKSKTKSIGKKLTRAPVPPGSDDGLNITMDAEDGSVELYPLFFGSGDFATPSNFPTTDNFASFPTPGNEDEDILPVPPPKSQLHSNSPLGAAPWEEEKDTTLFTSNRKSLTKAVVAAAASDATVHGRTFSQKDLRSKNAMRELSSDPVCADLFQSVGQSFKVKPTGAGGAAPPENDSPKSNSEMKYKIHLMENLFDDASGQQQKQTPQERRASVDPPGTPGKILLRADTGDAKVSSTSTHHSSRRKSSKSSNSNSKNAVVPPRDVDQDVSLIDETDSGDLEKGNCSDEATHMTHGLSASLRKSSVSSGSAHTRSVVGLFRLENTDKIKRRVYCLAILALIVVIGLIITLVVREVVTRAPAYVGSGGAGCGLDMNLPTGSPTSFQYDFLPDYTQQSLRRDGPQTRAYFWLDQDENRVTLSAQQALQRFVLATLFYATRGDHWKRSISWLVYARSECSWFTHEFHSVCDAANQYHTLSLPGNDLEGTLPEELEMLSTLNIVQLQDNKLIGKFPRRIWSSWEHLVFLNLHNNSLSGTLPPDVGFLAKASHLNTISLRKNQFSGYLPSELGLLPLEFLSLSNNHFSGTIPSQLGLLSNAKDLYLYENHISGSIPSALGQLSKLTRLELHNNDITGTVPAQLCDLMSNGNLTTLTVDCAKVRCTCGCDCTATMGLFIQDSLFDAGDGPQ